MVAGVWLLTRKNKRQNFCLKFCSYLALNNILGSTGSRQFLLCLFSVDDLIVEYSVGGK